MSSPSLPSACLQWKQEFGAANKADQSSYIERLPVELRLLIIENLPADNVRSIINLALTGPVYYYLISSNEAAWAEDMVVSAVGRDTMPLAATIYEAEAMGVLTLSPSWLDDDKSWGLVWKVIARHRGPKNCNNWHTQSRITKFSVAAKYLELDVAVKYWARKLARRALKNAYSMAPRRWDDLTSEPGPNATPTAAEMTRFCRALYIYHLHSVVFRWDVNVTPYNRVKWSYLAGPQAFWLKMPPWEFEQARQVEAILTYYWFKEMPYPSNKFNTYYSFLVEQGLRRLRLLDAISPWRRRKSMAGKLTPRRLDFWVPVMSERITPCLFDYNKNFNMETDFHAGKIFERYPEGDDGPKFWWYYVTLRDCATAVESPQYQLTSACRSCCSVLGYAFWDFERLRKMTCKECPSINDLLESTWNISVGETEAHVRLWKYSSLERKCNCLLSRFL
ncbi:hypothetical protein F4803DRAFT_568382 [Xylaria telfairii]|nr:hypothetical protein F4803DRAFT_568382 [Xylaria telfairii]